MNNIYHTERKQMKKKDILRVRNGIMQCYEFLFYSEFCLRW